MLALAVLALSACTSTVSVTAAPLAADPACARVLASLKGADELAGRSRREVDAQSTAAWGDPPVVLRCGVEPPGPTTQGCVEVGGVDWVGPADPATGDGRYTTYGRDPAVEVVVPDPSRGIDAVLGELAPAVSTLPRARECL